MKKHKNKITALLVDGGGAKGIFASKLVDSIGYVNMEKINLFAGVSAGSVLIMAYQFIDFDKVSDTGIKILRKVFQISKFKKLINLIFKGSLFSSKKLKKSLKKVFGDKKIKDLPKDKYFFITVTNFKKSKAEIINNIEAKWQEKHIWEVIYWSCLAPFCFSDKKCSYVDGGVSSNDPREILPFIKNILEKRNKEIGKIVSVGLATPSNQTKNGRWFISLKRMQKLSASVIDIASTIENETYNDKNTLIIDLYNKKYKNVHFSLTDVSDQAINFFEKRAKQEKQKLIAFLSQD